MPPLDQPITTYSDTTPHKRGIAGLIDIISPEDIPSVKYFGLDGDAGKFRIMNWPNYKVEWLEDELPDLTDALNGSITSNATTITVDDGSLFKSGDVVEVDSEMMWVSGISSQVLTVTRNYGGTQATHADDAVVTIISQARLEGDDADYERAATDRTAPYNYTQIFQEDIRVTRTQRKTSQYGIQDEFDYQAAKAIPHMGRLINKTFFNGQRKQGSATTPRAMGGLETFITDNTAGLSSAAITQKDLEDQIQACWEDGGNPDLIICNAWVKRKLSGFYSPYVRTERNEQRGGVRITYIETEFGELQILLDRWCPSAKLYIVESQYIGFLAFDPFFQEELAKTKDATSGQVVGEYSLVVKNDKAHGLISGISTTT